MSTNTHTNTHIHCRNNIQMWKYESKCKIKKKVLLQTNTCLIHYESHSVSEEITIIIIVITHKNRGHKFHSKKTLHPHYVIKHNLKSTSSGIKDSIQHFTQYTFDCILCGIVFLYFFNSTLHNTVLIVLWIVFLYFFYTVYYRGMLFTGACWIKGTLMF